MKSFPENIPDEVQFLVERFKQSNPTSNFTRWEQPLYQQLVEATDFLPTSAKATQRLWHIKTHRQFNPCVVCNQPTKWDNTTSRYRNVCGPKCNSINTKVQRRQTMLDTHGVNHYTESSEFLEKVKATSQRKYGTNHPRQSTIVKEKYKTTCIERYGAEAFTQSDAYRTKTRNTCKERYGVDFISQASVPTDSLNKLQNSEWLYDQHVRKQTTITKIAEELSVDSTTVASYCNKHNISIVRFSTTMWERELAEFLTHHNIHFVQNDRCVLNGKELDFILTEHNIAIELCGLYWHADIHNRIDKWTHFNKMQKCETVGLQLLTIFEDEWNNAVDQIYNKILYMVGKATTPKIYARRTKVITVDTHAKTVFFNTNHIQRNGPSGINYGLVDRDNNVVAVMGVIEYNDRYILNRYATSRIVVGGFSKLLKHFAKHHISKPLITFADRRWSTGDLYTTNNFVLVDTLPPDYSYVKNGLRSHKFKYRRKHLQRLLDEYDETKTERENCENAGMLRIWDCGKYKYQLDQRQM
jgi:hypothetical protein